MNINEAIKYLNDMRANCMNHKIDNYKDPKRAKKAEALQIAIESLFNSNITKENATDAYAVKDLDARESELLADACRCIDHYNDMTAVQKIELEGDLRKALSDAQEYNKMKTAAGQKLKIGDIVETYPWEYDGRMCVIMLKDDGTVSIMTDRGATKHDTSRGSSCPVAIGNALLEMYNEVKEDIGIDEPVQKKFVNIESKPITKKLFKNDQDAIDNGCCPQCGAALIRTGGCINCIDCGWTKCD